MGLYRPNTIISKYYMILFSLPNKYVLTILVVFYLLLSLIFLRENSIPYITYTLSIITILSIYSRFFSIVFKKIRRILGLTIITSVYALLIGFITSWDIGLLSSTAILVIVIQGLDLTKLYRYFIGLAPFYIVVLIMSLIYPISFDTIIRYFIVSIIIILIDLIIFWYFSRYKIKDYPVTLLGTYYLWNWLEKKKELDTIFEKLSEYKEINPVILKSNKFLLIAPDVHYGPFSNIGSSMLPKLLHDKLILQRWYPIILHGMGTHDRNMGSSKIMNEYIEYLLKLVKAEGRKQLLYGFFKLQGNDNWEITGIVFTDISLLFISRPGKGIDDLPYDLQLECNRKALEQGIGQVLLIDSHNWEEEIEFNLEILKELLDQALNVIKKIRKKKPVEIENRVTCISTKALGVIDGVLCGVEFKNIENNECFILIYMRGNNMAPGIRNKIIDLVKKYYQNNTYVEVVTNDEHTKTGTQAFIAYIPVQDTKELLDSIDHLLRKLVENRYDKDIYLIRSSVKYPLLGTTALKLIDLLIKTYPRIIIFLLFYVLSIPFIASLILNI